MLDAEESCSWTFQPAQFRGTVPAIQEMHKALNVGRVCMCHHIIHIWLRGPKPTNQVFFCFKLWIFGDPIIFSPTTDCLFADYQLHHDLQSTNWWVTLKLFNLHGDWSKTMISMRDWDVIWCNYWACWYDTIDQIPYQPGINMYQLYFDWDDHKQ